MTTIARDSNAFLRATGAALAVLCLLAVAVAGLDRPALTPKASITDTTASARWAGAGGQDEADAMFMDDVAGTWPEHVGTAARIFQCAPSAAHDTRHSVVVWTDARYKVIAYGTALAEEQVPTYAVGLSGGAALDASRIVHAAVPGFRVLAAHKRHALTLGGTTLGCVASAEE